jgi:hypothetical protein
MRKTWCKLMAVCLLVLVSTAGCSYAHPLGGKNPFAPKPFRMGGPGGGGTVEFRKGWDDGCETGMSTMVTDYYKTFYGFKQDPYMIMNDEYYKAWNDAYTYCRHYAFRSTLWTWDSD